MGNLDFLEKKTKYAIGWDGILEGKETFTNKGFNNDDPADTWCKISEYFPKEGSFVKTVGPISSAHGFDYDLSIANCHDAIVSRFFSDKYETISIKFDIGTIIVVHCDIDKCTIPGRSNIQYNSITFPTEGWWIKATMNGVNPVGALGVLMTISTAPRFMFSGKGFTSPKEYYSKLSNSIEADDYYTLWIDHTVIEAASGKEDDYNAICIPGDWNSKADIQLDEKLAKLLKAMSYNKVSAIVKYAEAVSKKTPENLGQIKTQQYITAWTVNKNQLNVYYGNDIIFRQTYDAEEHAKWYAKYFSNTP